MAISGPTTRIGAGGGLVVVNADGGVSVTPAAGKQLSLLPATSNDTAKLALGGGVDVAQWRVQRHTALDPSSNQDNVLAFVYNTQWTQVGTTGSWTGVDSASRPSYSFSFESQWQGNIELNLDVAAAGAAPGNWFRPLSLEAGLADHHIGFGVGHSVDAVAGGISVTGGALAGQVDVHSVPGQASTLPIFSLTAGSISAPVQFFKVHPTTGQIIMAVDGSNVSAAAWNTTGIFMLAAARGVNVQSTTTTAIPFSCSVAGDGVDRLEVAGAGKLSWGPGNAALDTTLYRSAVGLLKSDNTLQAAQGVATIVVAGAVSDASFTTAPPIGTLAVDSTGNLYAKTAAATWKKVAIA